MVAFSTCKKESPVAASVSFATPSISYPENAGLISIPIELNIIQNQVVTVSYTWSSPDTTTFLGGDFSFEDPSLTVVIPAGQTTAYIPIQVIDDTQIDGPDSVTLTLSGISPNASLIKSSPGNTFSLAITDNDVVPLYTLQADLVWYLAANRQLDINGANLDLYLRNGVVVNNANHQIVNQGSVFTSSTHLTGFETIYLNSSAPDSLYYFAIPYVSGSGAVNYILTLDGFGWTPNGGNNYLFETFASSDVTTTAFFGPFNKSDTTSFANAGSRNSGRSKFLRFTAKGIIK